MDKVWCDWVGPEKVATSDRTIGVQPEEGYLIEVVVVAKLL